AHLLRAAAPHRAGESDRDLLHVLAVMRRAGVFHRGCRNYFSRGKRKQAASRSLRTIKNEPASAGGFQVLELKTRTRASSRCSAELGSSRTTSPLSAMSNSNLPARII